MPLGRLDHYLILARDIEATRDFYADVLGLEVGERPPFPFPGYWLYLGDTACVHIAGARANAAQRHHVGNARADMGTGAVDHIAFVAHGLEEMLAHLDRLGIDTTRRDVPDQDLHQVFIRDPDGVKIELNFALTEAR